MYHVWETICNSLNMYAWANCYTGDRQLVLRVTVNVTLQTNRLTLQDKNHVWFIIWFGILCGVRFMV